MSPSSSDLAGIEQNGQPSSAPGRWACSRPGCKPSGGASTSAGTRPASPLRSAAPAHSSCGAAYCFARSRRVGGAPANARRAKLGRWTTTADRPGGNGAPRSRSAWPRRCFSPRTPSWSSGTRCPPSGGRPVAAMLAAWALFGVDYAVRWSLSGQRLGFVRAHPVDTVALLLPLLRPLRIVKVYEAVQRHRGEPRLSLHARVVFYAGLSSALLGFAGSSPSTSRSAGRRAPRSGRSGTRCGGPAPHSRRWGTGTWCR